MKTTHKRYIFDSFMEIMEDKEIYEISDPFESLDQVADIITEDINSFFKDVNLKESDVRKELSLIAETIKNE